FSKISNFEILEMPERQTNGTNNDRDILAILLPNGSICRGCVQPCIDVKRRRRYPLITPYEMRGTTG
ncbi:MAG: hypothetical protein LBR08_03545, partial [Bacteroidales bacterium]|nr:hypothetical protein [Bacteroidales bacterium]